MGAYSPLPDLDADAVERVLETVHRPILAEMARRGTPFRGFLYAGLMLTADGPVLLECNVRLGDPEAQVILPRIAGSLGPLLLAAASGRAPGRRAGPPPRAAATPRSASCWRPRATRATRAAATRSPASTRRRATGPLVFHAGTVGRPQGGYGTNGGRVLTVVGRGRDLAAAREAAERAADAITWDGLQRRHDIAADLPQPAEALA